MKIIISLILLLWKPVGSAHQLYHIYLKGIPVKHYMRILRNNKMAILESGWLGLLTPYLHWRWHKSAHKTRGLRKPVQNLHLEKKLA